MTKRSMRALKVFTLILVALIAFYIAECIDFYQTHTIHEPAMIQNFHGSKIIVTLRYFAENHNGNFPEKITPDILNGVPKADRQFQDPVTKQFEDWIYYGGYSIETSPPQYIILASPRTVRNHQERIVFFVDGSNDIIKEDEFQQRIKKQLSSK